MKRIFLFLLSKCDSGAPQSLRGMQRPRIQAVLGHEISHVENGDMVTLALLQGMLNTFVIFLARIMGIIVDRALFKNDREESGAARILRVPAARVASCGSS